MFESPQLHRLEEQSMTWLHMHMLSIDFALQLALIGVALLLGAAARKKLLPKVQPFIDKFGLHYRTKMIVNNVCRLIMQITAFLIIMLGADIAGTDLAGHINMTFARAVMALLAAWVAIKLIVQFIENSAVRNLFAITIWTVAALGIFGILDETTDALDSLGITLGTFRLSALSIVKGILALFMLLYAALFLSGFLERKVQSATSLTISSRVLIGKIIRVTLVTFALLIGVTSAGIDLSLFAVFSGALGLGVGFGLQKGISNLFSGMMLLVDKSIKPGDVIELPGVGGEGTFGWVEHMGARYTEIITRDNKSYLIPNEDFITKQVVNWSHGSTLIRIEVKFGVSYRHNPHEVKAIAEAASVSCDKRVVADPAPVCHLTAFGDSSLDFKLRFWIKDAEKGITNIRGAVMLALWDAFKENNIDIPYPHREVYIHEAVKKT
ncbi:MAG: mechanosensitive ion channel family protein [Alphaproteobacteria bacterium CG_4_9_14_3_um_filter_47_13]|nr:MAG: mechanosensitive ion channel family protein [Alphaproteobacteria bacterium CG_4_9_14_3_um_filter_47_13]